MFSSEAIAQELTRVRAFDFPTGVRVEPLPRRPDRLDHASRASFRVASGGRPLCHLTVGAGLFDLWKRTEAFAAACPTIACRPLFWHQAEGLDYLGTEFFEGRSLTVRVRDEGFPPTTAIDNAGRVLSALERTLHPSNADGLAQEIDALFGRVAALPIWAHDGLRFLQEHAFPFIRAGAGPFATRWSNGDFISSNVLVDDQGNVRLVDYEFAAPTHFFAEDGWRWRHYSPPPLADLKIPGLGTARSEDGSWLEAYCILRQLVLARATSSPQLVQIDATRRIRRLVALLAEAKPEIRASEFSQRFAPSLTAQVYWSKDGAFNEGQSQQIEFPPGQETTLRFALPSSPEPWHLRFDPTMTPGLIDISRLRVLESQTGRLLLDLSAAADWERIRFGPGLNRLSSPAGVSLQSLNDDPNLYLPVISYSGGLILEVTLRFTA